jgi:hypothetical protein
MDTTVSLTKLLPIILACISLLEGTAPADIPNAPTTTPVTGQAIDQWQWHPLWSRQADAIKSATDDQVRHDGRASIRIEHTGKDDWSLAPDTYGDRQRARMAVQEGDLLEVIAWIKLQGKGDTAVSVTTYDTAGKVGSCG